MSEKPLLLSSGRNFVLVPHTNTVDRKWLFAAAVLGLVVVLIGAADVTTRLAHAAFGDDTNMIAFAPAVAFGGMPFATSTLPVVPTELRIPAIGVTASVEEVGKKADGSMGTPTTFGDVAWYSKGSKPGAPGNAVFDGHVNNALTTAGVFEHLSQIKLGDVVVVSDTNGTSLTFIVTELDTYPVDDAPAASIFATTGPSQIILITCEGVWDAKAKTFDKRLVVTARLAH